jgi:SAM-dependent methyltransferase
MENDEKLKNKRKATYWLQPQDLLNFVYVHSRSFVSDFSKQISDQARESQIYREHIYIEKNELLEILGISSEHTEFSPSGIGVELGSGCAAISVELAHLYPKIEKIYAIEIVPEIVEYAAIPLIHMNKIEEKVKPIVGTFDEIKLEDRSVDFIIEFDSLHHSFDLNRTIKESARILKPGAKLLAIDRSHWSTSRKRRNELENTIYSQEFLSDRGLDINTRLTRAENGEHEYLLSEYLDAFEKAGFSNTDWVFLVDPNFSVIKQSLISAIPSRLRKRTKYHYIQTWPLRNLIFPVTMMRIFKLGKVGRYVNFPRNKDSKRFQAKTVIIATK